MGVFWAHGRYRVYSVNTIGTITAEYGSWLFLMGSKELIKALTFADRSSASFSAAEVLRIL